MKKKAIKIPVKKVKVEKSTDKVIGDLSDAGFEVSHLEKEDSKDMEVLSKGHIKLKFARFLKLVVSRDFDELMSLYKDEEVIVDADFLVELASESKQDDPEPESQSMTSSVLTGVLIGVLISFILFLIYVS